MMRVHPVAELFPMMQGPELDRLAVDIANHGLIRPITFAPDGILLDGRNRLKACEIAGIEPRHETYDGEPVAFILSTNVRTRHMNESQRSMIAARLANMRQGARTDLELSANLHEVSLEAAGDLLNVSRRSVATAVIVRDSGDEELIVTVTDGRVAVSKAATLAGRSEEFRRAVLAKINADPELAVTEAIRLTRKEFLPAEIARLPEGVFRLIYADPPWRYNDARQTGDHRQSTGAFDHYGDMTVEELCDLDVKALAAPDSVLLMWATFPLLREALAVIDAWGFSYKTAFVWDKGHGSFGHYHDAEAELLMIAVRGSCTPDAQSKEKQIQRFARSRHSAKPNEWRALIDRLWLPVPSRVDRIELFRRGEALEGWAVWGAEAAA